MPVSVAHLPLRFEPSGRSQTVHTPLTRPDKPPSRSSFLSSPAFPSSLLAAFSLTRLHRRCGEGKRGKAGHEGRQSMTDALIKGGWTSSHCLLLASFCRARWRRTISCGVGGGSGKGNQKNKAAAPAVGTGCLLNKHRL